MSFKKLGTPFCKTKETITSVSSWSLLLIPYDMAKVNKDDSENKKYDNGAPVQFLQNMATDHNRRPKAQVRLDSRGHCCVSWLLLVKS